MSTYDWMMILRHFFSFFFMQTLLAQAAVRKYHDDDSDHGIPLKGKIRHLMKTENRHLMVEEEYATIDAILPKVNVTTTLQAPQSSRTLDRNLTSITSRATYSVVVVGAGFAGANAARVLKAKGISNVKILEARDYVGGRSNTVMESWEGNDVPIDLGCQWIHGKKKNPIQKLVSKYDVPFKNSIGLQKVYKSNNEGAIPSSELESYEEELFSGGFMPYQAKKQDSTNVDKPLRSIADEYRAKKGIKNFDAKLYEYFLHSFIPQEYAASLEDLSLWWWDSDGVYGGSDTFLHDGYSQVIQKHANPVSDQIETGAKVTKIDYSSPEVKVTYDMSNGSTKQVTADAVIVTVPLGVLKANAITFQPALPSKQQKAINKIGYGLMNKIIMFFDSDDVFWPMTTEWLGNSDDPSIEFYNPYSLNGGKPILIGFLVGRDAQELEDDFGSNDSAYRNKFEEMAMDSLKSMFGTDIPNPGKVHVTKWGSDEFSYGSYSYNKVKIKFPKDRKNLAKPIQKRLYFSGEATHSKYFGTSHGAYLAGQAVAKKVANALA